MYKNESLELVTDDELLEFMKEQFDGVCQGSLDYLEDTSLEDYARIDKDGRLVRFEKNQAARRCERGRGWECDCRLTLPKGSDLPQLVPDGLPGSLV